MEWARAARAGNRMVVINIDDKLTLADPDGEFYLGAAAENDHTVRQFSGNRLVSARLATAAERAAMIISRPENNTL